MRHKQDARLKGALQNHENLRLLAEMHRHRRGGARFYPPACPDSASGRTAPPPDGGRAGFAGTEAGMKSAANVSQCLRRLDRKPAIKKLPQGLKQLPEEADTTNS